jgi:hypothetical protein
MNTPEAIEDSLRNEGFDDVQIKRYWASAGLPGTEVALWRGKIPEMARRVCGLAEGEVLKVTPEECGVETVAAAQGIVHGRVRRYVPAGKRLRTRVVAGVLHVWVEASREEVLRKAVAEDGCDVRVGSAAEVLEKMMRAAGMSEEAIQRVLGAAPEREKYPWET